MGDAFSVPFILSWRNTIHSEWRQQEIFNMHCGCNAYAWRNIWDLAIHLEDNAGTRYI